MAFRIELKKVTKQFGEFTALKNVTGVIGQGDRISILGHNGAGKSTLLNVAATLSKPTSGEVHFYDGDREIKNLLEVRRNLTYLSHEPMLYPDLTSIENLRFTARIYGMELTEDQFTELLESVGMGRARNRVFRTCSRGMQQRLSMARALIPQPNMLLLDEPFSGLDNDGVARMIKLLDTYSWVMVTHDLRMGYEMANRFWIFRRGKLVHDVTKEGLSFEKYMELSRVPAMEALSQ